MFEADRANYHTGKRISVTMLTGSCKRKTLLERTLPYYLEPNQVLPTVRGSLIHSMVETAKDHIEKYIGKTYWQFELHMKLPVTTAAGEWELAGTLDAWEELRQTIHDIKTLQEYAVFKMVTGGNEATWSDHIPDYYVLQLNFYRYMAEKLYKYVVKRLRMQLIGFGQFITTGHDRQIVGLKKGFKWTRDEYDVPDVPILPDKVIEGIIQEEGDLWYRILFEGAKAAVCSKDYSWLCKSCQFKGTRWCPDPDKERKDES
jgi:hypothetical protein